MRFHPERIIIAEDPGRGANMRRWRWSSSNGRPGKSMRISGGLHPFAPTSAVYRYGAKHWVEAALRVDVSPRAARPMEWKEGA